MEQLSIFEKEKEHQRIEKSDKEKDNDIIKYVYSNININPKETIERMYLEFNKETGINRYIPVIIRTINRAKRTPAAFAQAKIKKQNGNVFILKMCVHINKNEYFKLATEEKITVAIHEYIHCIEYYNYGKTPIKNHNIFFFIELNKFLRRFGLESNTSYVSCHKIDNNNEGRC